MTRALVGLFAALFVGTLALLAPTSARAAGPTQNCSKLKQLDGAGTNLTMTDAPPVVYVAGSSAVKPLIAALAPLMYQDNKNPTTVVYLSQGSCTGVDDVLNGTALPTNTNAIFWDPNSNTAAAGSTTAKEETCQIQAGTFADLGVSDVFAQSCGYATQGIPQGYADFQGPIQSMTFAVPIQSSQSVISAEAAYLTFGFANVPPWTDTNFIYRRSPTSGTQTMIAAALGLDKTRWVGQAGASSDVVFNNLTMKPTNQAEYDKSIGILSADYSGPPRGVNLKQLAYKHYGQRCGYKPDVMPYDKRNVREGRYAIWGPLHLLSKVDGSGLATNKNARDLVAYLLGTVPPPGGVNLVRIEVQAHVVPPCAMEVKRDAELGPVSAFVPPVRCGCAFDKEAGVAPVCSKTCSAPSDCGSGEVCSFGFCEKK